MEYYLVTLRVISWRGVGVVVLTLFAQPGPVRWWLLSYGTSLGPVIPTPWWWYCLLVPTVPMVTPTYRFWVATRLLLGIR